MKYILALLVAALFTGTMYSADNLKLGKKITVKEKTSISDILKNPLKYKNKRVLVEGTVSAVCQKAGCWMEIKGDVETDIIKIKVKDGEIIFPDDAAGKKALVQGKVYEIRMTKEEVLEFEKHNAEESGKTFDASKVTGPRTIYQIRGEGAEIMK